MTTQREEEIIMKELEKIINSNKSKASNLRNCLLNLNRNIYTNELHFQIIQFLGEFEYDLKTVYENLGIKFSINDDISFKYQCNSLVELIVEICLKYTDFYNFLLGCKEFEDVNYLNKIGNEINLLTEEADYRIKLIEKIKIKNSKIFVLYGYYLNHISSVCQYFF